MHLIYLSVNVKFSMQNFQHSDTKGNAHMALWGPNQALQVRLFFMSAHGLLGSH